MAIDFIPVVTGGNYRAARLFRAVKACREALDTLEEVKNTMDHHVADPDYSNIEGSSGYGVPAGQGQTVYNLVAGAYARLNHADIASFIDRIGE